MPRASLKDNVTHGVDLEDDAEEQSQVGWIRAGRCSKQTLFGEVSTRRSKGKTEEFLPCQLRKTPKCRYNLPGHLVGHDA